MIKLSSTIVACTALVGVVAAQGQTGQQGHTTATERSLINNRPHHKKYETMAEKIKKARSIQSQSAHLRLKLGLMGLNPLDMGSAPGVRGLPGLPTLNAGYNTSAMSRMAEGMRHNMLLGYQSYGSQKKLRGILSGANSPGMNYSDKLKLLSKNRTRATGTGERRRLAEKLAMQAQQDRLLHKGNTDLMAQAKAKGLKLPSGTAPASLGTAIANQAGTKGNSTQASASSTDTRSSIYQGLAGFGLSSADKAKVKAKAAGQGAQETQSSGNGKPKKGSIYKTGN